MASAATVLRPAPSKAAPAARKLLVPFVRAAHEHVEPAFDVTATPGASAVQLGPFDIPANGFLRAVWCSVVATGGTLGAGALAADFPYSVFDDVLLFDTGGQELFHESGYDTFLANIFGGYTWSPNIASLPDAVVNNINFTWFFRIPVEIDAWDGYGALPNESGAQPYKVRLVLAPSTTIFSTAPTTIPAVRIRGYIETWTHPQAQDQLGNDQEQAPPGVGTTQFWSFFPKVINSGVQTIQLSRVGNLIRTLLVVYRDSTAANGGAGARLTISSFPDQIQLNWDNVQLLIEQKLYRRNVMFERYGFSPPDGVLAYDLSHDQDGHPGNESRHLWLPTVGATRLEFQGNWGSAGTVKILTNDVAPQAGR